MRSQARHSRGVGAHAILLILAVAALPAAGCFDPDRPTCAFLCGPDKACPDDYSCGVDNRCHLLDENGALLACEAELPGDGAVDATAVDSARVDTTPVDSATVDTTPVDSASPDTASPDAASPDALSPDGPVDASLADAGLVDAASIDSAPIDAAPIDAAPIDAVPIDAAPIDAMTATIAGHVRVLDVSEADHAERGSGGLVDIVLTNPLPTPVYDDRVDGLGCAAWLYDLSAAALPTPTDQGAISVTGATAAVPSCVFSDERYLCMAEAGTGAGADALRTPAVSPIPGTTAMPPTCTSTSPAT